LKYGISEERTVAKGVKDFNCYVFILKYNAMKYCFAYIKTYLTLNMRDNCHSDMENL